MDGSYSLSIQEDIQYEFSDSGNAPNCLFQGVNFVKNMLSIISFLGGRYPKRKM